VNDWLTVARWGWREWLLVLLADVVFVTLVNFAGADLPWWFWVAAGVVLTVVIDVAEMLGYRRTNSAKETV
jgi:hypothetical protein